MTLARHTAHTEREADVGLLLEAALFRLPLPPLDKNADMSKDKQEGRPLGHERSSPGWGTYLCAGLIARRWEWSRHAAIRVLSSGNKSLS